MGRVFSHPLGVYKFSNPLNSLSRLKSRHSRPNLGLVHSESNRSNIKNAADALRVQTDLNSSNSRNNWATQAISRPWVKRSHQSRENQIWNNHHGRPTHPSENALESKILKLRKINISPRNYFSLSKVLFVPLVVLHGTEQRGVKPHISVSLWLRWLRQLS